MMHLFLILLFLIPETHANDFLIKEVSYYGGCCRLKPKMRMERVYRINKDGERDPSFFATKIFLDETNELREMSLRVDGKTDPAPSALDVQTIFDLAVTLK